MNIDWSKAPRWANEVGTVNGGSPAWLSDSGYCFHGIANPPCHPYNAVNYTRDKFTVVARRPWTGEGLPPAGTVCEIHHICWGLDDWQQTDIKYISSDYLIVGGGAFKSEQHFHISDMSFRPARTAEQIATEERETKSKEMMDIIANERSDAKAAYALYDLGYRKQEHK